MKQQLKAEVNRFTKGIITEASELAFPSDATSDEQNFEITSKGIRKRRLGIDFESGNVWRGLTLYTNPSRIGKIFLWKDVSGISGKDFLVSRTGDFLYFYRTDNSFSYSSQFIASLNITSILSPRLAGPGIDPVPDEINFASIEGVLVISSGFIQIGIVSFTEPSTFSLTTSSLKVRDLWGVEETDATTEGDPSYNPVSLTDSHYYNLHNQSWGLPRRNAVPSLVDPVSEYFTGNAKYPSNSENVWTGIQYTPVTGTADPYEQIYPGLYLEGFNGGLQAAKGYFIIDLLSRGASRIAAYDNNQDKHPELTAKGAITLPDDESSRGPSIIAKFAGRIWYGGFEGEVVNGDARSPSLGNFVLFSQLVKNVNDINKCYQEGDPTSRENTDIVDTDGGFIKVAGMGFAIAFAVFRDSLIVFGNNGVWRVFGGSDYGFTASNYKVENISDKVCVSPESIVTVNSDIMFWGKDGIYVITKNQFGDVVVDSMTAKTIHSLYMSIPEDQKLTAKGAYCSLCKRVHWVYDVDKELVFNMDFSGFTKNVFNSTDDEYFIYSVISVKPTDPLTYMIGRVQPFGLDYVLSHTFGSLKNTDFKDYNQIDAFAYMQTGFITGGDSSAEKQAPYIVTHMVKTESGIDGDGVPLNQSSCLIRGKWGWSDSAISGKWSTPQEAYRYRKALYSDVDYDNGHTVITTKNKLRGRGRSLALYFETQPEKDCQVIGWNLTMNGNATT